MVKNAPNMKSLIFQGSIDNVSEITHDFMFKMLKDKDLAIIVQSLDRDRDRGNVYEMSIKDFLKGKGSTFYKKYMSIEIEFAEQYWMRYGTRDIE